MEVQEEGEKLQGNALYILLYAFKMRFNRWINKLVKRLNCSHNNWRGTYCIDTQLFMYKQCSNCGKKSTRP